MFLRAAFAVLFAGFMAAYSFADRPRTCSARESQDQGLDGCAAEPRLGLQQGDVIASRLG